MFTWLSQPYGPKKTLLKIMMFTWLSQPYGSKNIVKNYDVHLVKPVLKELP